tara:strand:+ start:862 stop:2778 length:1917 start_codon:yes stop_codon:yes gene_type:complete
MGLSLKQIEMMQEISNSVEPEAPGELTRFTAQGLTFGFSDEIEAAVRSAASKVSSDPRTYEDIRNEIRGQLKAYETANPGKALSAELAGAILPSIVMSMTGVGTAGAATNLSRVIGVNALQGGVEALGKSESENASGMQAAETGTGAGVGATVGTAFEKILGRAGSAGIKVYNALRKRYGSGYNDAIGKYMLDVMESTGAKNIDDVIEMIKNGEVIGDNPVLVNEIKAIVNSGGEAADTTLRLSAQRAGETQEQAVGSINRALDPDGQNDNLYARVMDDEADEMADLGDRYRDKYGEFPNVPNIIALKMKGILLKNPEAQKILIKIYKNDPTSSPLFKTVKDPDTGMDKIEFIREPNLHDAERLRRRINTMQRKEVETGDPDLGRQYGRVEQSLRGDIDKFSPDLALVRADFSVAKSKSDAFNQGSRKGLSGKPDEQADKMRGMSDDMLESYRQGTLHSFRNQKRATSYNIQQLAKEGEKQNLNIQQMIPEDQANGVMDNISTAAAARQMNNAIQPKYGSPTQALQKIDARVSQGPGITGTDVLRASQGDPMAITGMIGDIIGFFKSNKGYTDAERSKVAEILFSSDPQFVTNLLKDETNWGKIADMSDTVAPYVMQSLSTNVNQQSSSAASGLLEDL